MGSTTTPFEWLPMPSGISLTGHSFTTDLLKQFDKQRSVLDGDDEDALSIAQSSHSHIIVASSTASRSMIQESDTESRSSADVIHGKSSVYLRNKINDDGFHNTPQTVVQQIEQPRASTIFNSWTLKRKKKFHLPAQDIFDPNNETPPLSKIAINTTININHTNTTADQNIIQPPVITQYPPKPLKYSPVEPLPSYASTPGTESSRRKTLQRFSLPLLKLTTAAAATTSTPRSIQRRRSDSDLLNQQQPQTTNTLFRSISKRWNKLLCTCKKRGVRKKK